MTQLHRPTNPVRFVTASSLFDGHDASINIMRRILQSQGAEVIHLGHNRSVQEVVEAAVEEDVQGVAVSSYQGGHVEYFEYLVESLKERGAGHILVYGGGGGVIVPEEIARLKESGVTIFSPEDGQRLGLVGMINSMIRACDTDLWAQGAAEVDAVLAGDRFAVARAVTGAENGKLPEDFRATLLEAAASRQVPVLGITGTGGSGKSSLTDELVRRFRVDQEDKLKVAVIAVDPTRRRGGGALLGDRIRMNSLNGEATTFRSLATRGEREVPDGLGDVIAVMKAAGNDLVIVETPGIGQGDAGILPFVDHSLYVMTPEFGAASQLEKIDMLDFADTVAINKFERRGPRTRCATLPASWCATARPSASVRRTCPSTARRQPPSTTTASLLSTSVCATPWSSADWSSARAPCRGSTYATPRASPRWCRATGSATSPRSPTPFAATTPRRSRTSRPPVGCNASPRCRPSWRPRAPSPGSTGPAGTGQARPPARCRRPDQCLARCRRVLLGRRADRVGPRP
ncbi:cobalamin-dependent protein [Nocardioides alcanivorans]|uniref:cobalamin-dependent protein n=1 Tax=Nocardioides alcanivorans TaxID=2897352 RepID=UPI004068E1DB